MDGAFLILLVAIFLVCCVGCVNTVSGSSPASQQKEKTNAAKGEKKQGRGGKDGRKKEKTASPTERGNTPDYDAHAGEPGYSTPGGSSPKTPVDGEDAEGATKPGTPKELQQALGEFKFGDHDDSFTEYTLGDFSHDFSMIKRRMTLLFQNHCNVSEILDNLRGGVRRLSKVGEMLTSALRKSGNSPASGASQASFGSGPKMLSHGGSLDWSDVVSSAASSAATSAVSSDCCSSTTSSMDGPIPKPHCAETASDLGLDKLPRIALWRSPAHQRRKSRSHGGLKTPGGPRSISPLPAFKDQFGRVYVCQDPSGEASPSPSTSTASKGKGKGEPRALSNCRRGMRERVGARHSLSRSMSASHIFRVGGRELRKMRVDTLLHLPPTRSASLHPESAHAHPRVIHNVLQLRRRNRRSGAATTTTPKSSSYLPKPFVGRGGGGGHQ